MVMHGSSASLISSAAADKRKHPWNSSDDSATFQKLTDDPSSFGSMLDQLHAEQKGTIEALTSQVEFFRQREERARQELATLRRCLPLAKDDDACVSAAKLSSENRTLGDELDAMCAKKSGWDRDRSRLERQKKDLECQLKDAKHTLTGFSQAIEQLEIKMQRKGAEMQTRCLELENELSEKLDECEQLRREKMTMQQRLNDLQASSDENAQLRFELKTLLPTAEYVVGDDARSSQLSSEIKSVSEKFSNLEKAKRRQEEEIQELQRQLAASTAEVLATKREVGRKNSEIKEMQLKLDTSTSIFTMRDQLLATDDTLKKEFEAQRQRLSSLVSTLEREKSDLQNEISDLQREQKATTIELQAAKSRLITKDRSVLVSTLRNEVSSLKEQLRNEFMLEKECLTTETQSLKHEITLLRGRLADKDLATRNLEKELVRSEEKQQQKDYDFRQQEEQISRLKIDLEQSRTKYQQLQQCRTALAEQLDFGFKELMNDEESAASANEELEKLRSDFKSIKQENVALASERQALTEELDRLKCNKLEASSRQTGKIHELYRQLLEKEDTITSLKNVERQVALLQQEKEEWESNVTDVRLKCESRVELEVRKADTLRSRIDQLEQEKVSLKLQIDALKEEKVEMMTKLQSAELSLSPKEKVIKELEDTITHLTKELADATEHLNCGRQDITTREQKLLKEHKKMQNEIGNLVYRIESAGIRNVELGEKVIALAKHSKMDQTDLVALSSQVKSYKIQVKSLESQLGQVHRRNGQESESICDLQRKLNNITCLKESYQVEISKLRQRIEQLQSEYTAAKQERDDAVKRVHLLVQCRDDMKVTVEDHTAELVEEIEAIQHQMDSERKRCAVLLANEKTLLRDLYERNGVVMKLQHTVSVLQRQVQNKSSSSSDRSRSSISGRRRRSEGSSDVNSPVSSSNQSTTPTANSFSPPHQRHSQPRLQSNSPSSCGCSLTPAKELEHLLSKVEHTSNFLEELRP